SPRRRAASNPSTAMASERAMTTKSGFSRASRAARIFCAISSTGMTLLPSKWPHRFGQTLILDMDSGDPGVLELAHRAPHVERVAESRVGIADDRDADRQRNIAGHLHDLGHRDE